MVKPCSVHIHSCNYLINYVEFDTTCVSNINVSSGKWFDHDLPGGLFLRTFYTLYVSLSSFTFLVRLDVGRGRLHLIRRRRVRRELWLPQVETIED